MYKTLTVAAMAAYTTDAISIEKFANAISKKIEVRVTEAETRDEVLQGLVKSTADIKSQIALAKGDDKIRLEAKFNELEADKELYTEDESNSDYWRGKSTPSAKIELKTAE